MKYYYISNNPLFQNGNQTIDTNIQFVTNPTWVFQLYRQVFSNDLLRS